MTSRPGPANDDTDRSPRDPAPGPARGAVPVLVLLSAEWAGPSRPAPTLLRELARRWGPRMDALLIEDPDDEILDRWSVTHLPTWLRFAPAEGSARVTGGGATAETATEAPLDSPPPAGGGTDGAEHLVEDVLRGDSPGGEELALPGPWILTHRRSGALPKHVVEAELGPSAH